METFSLDLQDDNDDDDEVKTKNVPLLIIVSHVSSQVSCLPESDALTCT